MAMTTRESDDRARTRRQFLQGGVAAAAAAATWSFNVLPSGALGSATGGRKVAILGGGVAGLSAAHELIDRGFDVTVYERKALGGKARTISVPGSGRSGRPDLPGEHGFRFFPGFYHNLGDTMRRIPDPASPTGTTHGNLVRATEYLTSRQGGFDVTFPFSLPNPFDPDTWLDLLKTIASGLNSLGKVSLYEIALFAQKAIVYFTSCDERRLGQWENITYRDFLHFDRRSAEFDSLFGDGLVRNLAATKARDASTHSVCYVGEATVLSLLGRGNEPGGFIDRVLDGPTTEKWLGPWIDHLSNAGVKFEVGWTVTGLTMASGRVASATARNTAGATQTINADWFICSMPSERSAQLIANSPGVVTADPKLADIARLRQDWMNGLMFYLRTDMPITHGHVNYVDSPFAVTSISQKQFWNIDLRNYGDGGAVECVSTIISDWFTPGVLYGKAAKDCTPDQIKAEVWEQMKRHLNDTGGAVLTDDMLHSWFLDPAIINPGTSGVTNDEPLFIQQPGSWNLRPNSTTRIPNLFLAGDWVRNNINVTTMEGANEGARLAVNGLLAAAGSSAPRCTLGNLYVPPEFALDKAEDRVRYGLRLPNKYDIYETAWP
jgi:uncharacterized protein with NAD-binding domain and iron-sulfur cluster